MSYAYNRFKSTTVYGNFTNADEKDSSNNLVNSARATFNGAIIQTYKSNDNVAIGNTNTLSTLTVGTSSRKNIAIGGDALKSATISSHNIALGYNTSSALTTGSQNVAIGTNAGSGITTGNNNIAIGVESLKTTTTGFNNVCVGVATMRDNINSDETTAIGHQAGLNCIRGNDNTFIGAGSDFDSSGNTWNNSTCIGRGSQISDSNQITLGRSSDYVHIPNPIVQTYKSNDNIAIGNKNTLVSLTVDPLSRRNVAIGADALKSLTFARNNIAIGYNTLPSLTTGLQNMAFGTNACSSLTIGHNNIAIGVESLKTNTGQINNVCIGVATLRDNTDSDSVTAIGHEAGLNCIHGNDNTFIGAGSGLDNSANTWNNSTAIGTQSKISDSNQITLGRSSDYVYMPNSYVKINNNIRFETPKTTVNGSTSGTAIFTMPFQGGSYKKVVIYCNNLTGACAYSFPTTFTYTPAILSNSSLVSSLTTSVVYVTGSASNGFVILEGF